MVGGACGMVGQGCLDVQAAGQCRGVVGSLSLPPIFQDLLSNDRPVRSATNARRVALYQTDDPANPYPLAIKPRDTQPNKRDNF